MIKENQQLFNKMHVFLDAGMTACTYGLAWFIGNHSINRELIFTSEVYLLIGASIVILYVILYHAYSLYKSKRVQKRAQEAVNIFKANTTGFVLLNVLYLIAAVTRIKDGDLFNEVLLYFYAINTILNIWMRYAIRFLLYHIRKRGYNLKHIILVGYSKSAEAYIDRVQANPQWGYRIRGIIDDSKALGQAYKGIQIIGRVDELPMLLKEKQPDEIAITLRLEEYKKLGHIVFLCEKTGVHTKFIPDYNNIIETKPCMEDIQGLPIIHIRNVPLSNAFKAFIKRGMDLIGAVLCLILFLPVMLIAAVLICITSKGGIIYSQERVGKNNRLFQMYKFRSMKIQSVDQEKSCWTVENDPRITKIGRFLRKTSMDELPQLFNVLKGEMSLIGPRPERPLFVEKFKEEIPKYMIKHQVRPGMTGWAQMNGYRGDTSIEKRIEFDLYYIENWTVSLDIKILFLTVFKGFVNKNAY